ncbi:NAD(P)H-binding protein [Jannaschia sp. W003]|uniref:NAD(P)H-binding protein n=1 Tax=Jannaschia sp. W003 TaxID=2867012 RepID=UPI0021A94464|nr:NAD(P)H-binding protein [Jannaschia sp. W003]UWQ22183.1 NAD(P)H-binding protein [Jannaschia sp. W003]
MSLRVAMVGATGAVGGHALAALLADPRVGHVTVLGRRPTGRAHPKLRERIVAMDDAAALAEAVPDADAALSTLGVGEPSAADAATFRRVDHDLPLAFARAARARGARHFTSLGSIGAGARGMGGFLRTKGELERAIGALGFEGVSLLRPSMILTPENRYGASQAATLWLWPRLAPVLRGPLLPLRGIPVERLGRAAAAATAGMAPGVAVLRWPELDRLADEVPPPSAR